MLTNSAFLLFGVFLHCFFAEDTIKLWFQPKRETSSKIANNCVENWSKVVSKLCPSMMRNTIGSISNTTIWSSFLLFLQGERDLHQKKKLIEPKFNTKRAYLGPIFYSTTDML